MPNVVSTGASTASTTAAAAAEALGTAQAGLGSSKPSFGFLFASPRLSLQEALLAARTRMPGTDFVGCTTAREITERGRTDGGLAVLLVASDGMEHVVHYARNLKAAPAKAVTDLCAGFSERRESARARGLGVSNSVLLVDALSGAGELLVDGLHQSMGALHEIVGGAAGDEGKFVGTLVGSAGTASTDSAALLHVYGRNRWGVGVDHGLTPATPPMRVTRAKANVVYEIDGRPAYQVYEEFAAKRGVKLERAAAPAYFIQNELGLLVFDTQGTRTSGGRRRRLADLRRGDPAGRRRLHPGRLARRPRRRGDARGEGSEGAPRRQARGRHPALRLYLPRRDPGRGVRAGDRRDQGGVPRRADRRLPHVRRDRPLQRPPRRLAQHDRGGRRHPRVSGRRSR